MVLELAARNRAAIFLVIGKRNFHAPGHSVLISFSSSSIFPAATFSRKGTPAPNPRYSVMYKEPKPIRGTILSPIETV
jgi:hypothetical protein